MAMLAALLLPGGVLALTPGPASASSLSPDATAAAVRTDYWPAFHHDATHKGVSADQAIAASTAPSLGLKWKVPVGGGPHGHAPVYASPAVAYNTTLGKTLVYIPSTGNPSKTDAIDIATGQVVWSLQLSTGVYSSPAVAGNSVYFGSGTSLYAVDATTGQVQCSFDTGGRIQASPAVDNTGSVVFVGDVGISEKSNGGHEWAITAVGNPAGSCQPKWAFNGWLNKGTSGTKTGSWSSPALATDTTGRLVVVVGSSNPDDAVYSLDASNGSEIWRFQTVVAAGDEDVGAGPTIGAPGANAFPQGVVYVDGKDKIEYALNLLTGTQIWAFDMGKDAGVGANSQSTASLAAGMVIVPYATFIYALDARTGAVLWRSSTGGTAPILASPAVSGAPGDQVVLIGDTGGLEHAYRLSDGTSLFQFSTGKPILSSTAVSLGKAIFACNNGSIYALG